MSYAPQNLRATFAAHPFSEANILRRLQHRRGTLDNLTAFDLAADRATELTDQNHVGGAAFVDQLARAAGAAPGCRVLDLGCGLGGASRLLAARHGCRVHGIDLSPKRCREARSLNRRVGLTDQIDIQCADYLSTPLPADSYQLLWGQGAWLHPADKDDFVRRWASCLAPDGRLACEHACLARPPRTHAESSQLGELATLWNAFFITCRQWVDHFAQAGLRLLQAVDLTPSFIRYYGKLHHLAQTHLAAHVPLAEQRSWDRARGCAQQGLIVYVRLVAGR
ncbi:MAG: methyltransferase domain-containing protein [Candidatus Latescibacteria bacterium]|nr:methyltransferase domain-containing protein [Candidatus Latescibacterota bacterium]